MADNTILRSMMVMPFFEDLIAISDIRQYVFCPRIPWYKYVMNFTPPEQAWVTQGKRWHKEQETQYKRRVSRYIKYPVQYKANVYVQSISLNIHGYIDELITNDEQCVVVEYKIRRC